MKHRAVADPVTGRGAGRIHDRLHLVVRQVGHKPGIAPLERNRQDAANLIECGRLAVLQKPEEGPNRRQPDVARRGAVAARRLKLLEKGADQGGVELLEGEGTWYRLQSLCGKREQRAEAVRV